MHHPEAAAFVRCVTGGAHVVRKSQPVRRDRDTTSTRASRLDSPKRVPYRAVSPTEAWDPSEALRLHAAPVLREPAAHASAERYDNPGESPALTDWRTQDFTHAVSGYARVSSIFDNSASLRDLAEMELSKQGEADTQRYSGGTAAVSSSSRAGTPSTRVGRPSSPAPSTKRATTPREVGHSRSSPAVKAPARAKPQRSLLKQGPIRLSTTTTSVIHGTKTNQRKPFSTQVERRADHQAFGAYREASLCPVQRTGVVAVNKASTSTSPHKASPSASPARVGRGSTGEGNEAPNAERTSARVHTYTSTTVAARARSRHTQQPTLIGREATRTSNVRAETTERVGRTATKTVWRYSSSRPETSSSTPRPAPASQRQPGKGVGVHPKPDRRSGDEFVREQSAPPGNRTATAPFRRSESRGTSTPRDTPRQSVRAHSAGATRRGSKATTTTTVQKSSQRFSKPTEHLDLTTLCHSGSSHVRHRDTPLHITKMSLRLTSMYFPARGHRLGGRFTDDVWVTILLFTPLEGLHKFSVTCRTASVSSKKRLSELVARQERIEVALADLTAAGHALRDLDPLVFGHMRQACELDRPPLRAMVVMQMMCVICGDASGDLVPLHDAINVACFFLEEKGFIDKLVTPSYVLSRMDPHKYDSVQFALGNLEAYDANSAKYTRRHSSEGVGGLEAESGGFLALGANVRATLQEAVELLNGWIKALLHCYRAQHDVDARHKGLFSVCGDV